MKRFLIFVILIATVLGAKEYIVISNGSVKNLKPFEIKAIFLKKKKYHNDKKLVPINLAPNTDIRKSFEKNILKSDFGTLKRYWIKRHYMGIRPPITLKSQKSVIKFVKKIDGAIGYIEAKNLEDGLFVIYRWGE